MGGERGVDHQLGYVGGGVDADQLAPQPGDRRDVGAGQRHDLEPVRAGLIALGQDAQLGRPVGLGAISGRNCAPLIQVC
jgi:hypothetical protein